MNVYFIVVWCTVIFGCLSVPQKRHKHVRYPVQTFEDVNRNSKNQSVKAVLENKLLNKYKLPLRSSNQRHLIRNKHNLEKHMTLSSSKNPNGLDSSGSRASVTASKAESFLSGFEDSVNDRCPLCRRRKSVEQSVHHKRSYESLTNNLGKSTGGTTAYDKTAVDDFFGLFTHQPLRNRSLSSKKIETLKNSYSMDKTTTATTKESKRNSSTHRIADRPLAQMPMLEESNDSHEPIFNFSQDTQKKRLMPAESKLLTDTKMLYLDSDESNRNKKFYQEFEDEGIGDEKTESHLEATAEEIPEDSIIERDTETTSHVPTEESTSTTHEEEYALEDKVDPDSSNAAKKKCQIDSKKKCICSFASLVLSIQKTFAMGANTKTVLKEASHLHCSQYVPIPDAFDLSSNSQPKILSANKKPMTVDGGKGPKEIEEHSLIQFIHDSVDDEDDEMHVFVNTDVKISCFPSNDVHLSASDADHVQYKWTRGKKQAITDGRITENSDGEGTLLIESATLADSENYTCDVDYVNPDTGQRTTDAFVHPLSVVTLPTVTARAALHLRSAGGCDASLLEVFQLYLPQLVEAALCGVGGGGGGGGIFGGGSPRLCSVQLHSPACHSGSSQESTELSLNLEVYMHRQAEREVTAGNGSRSDPKCHLVLTLRLLQIFKENLAEIATVPVVTDHETRKFTPVANSVKIKYIFGCIGGYHLDSGFCVACPKHTYSADGDTECTKCPAHSYQGSVGARRCIPCSVAWIPACNEYMESENVWMIVGVIALVVALFAGFVIWYAVSVKNKKLADVKKLVVATPLAGKRKVKFGKTQKSIRRKRFEDTELQSLLESESDGQSSTDATIYEKRKKGNNAKKEKPKAPVITVSDSDA